jgi:hypothetical protein
MASVLVATACPHCRKSIKVPHEYVGKSVRCKSCTKVFKVQDGPAQATSPVAAEKKPAPVVEKKLPATSEPETYVQQLARQQRSSSWIFLIVALLAIGAIGAGLFVFKDQLFALADKATQQQVKTTQPAPQGGLLNNNEVIDKLGGDLTSMPDQDKRDKRKLARIPAPYPGRALLIGIRDYLYLNPLNPGFRLERSFLGDALGLQSLRRNLITELSFPRDQVVLLSDVDDQKPIVPTKASIEANVEEFLTTSRAGDRVVLALAMHAVHLAGKTYLIPIDGELPPEGAKADAERDAKLASKLIPLSWLYEKLKACPAKQKLLILDIAQSDPEAGITRQSPGPLTEAMFAELQKVPEGVQVWLPCQAKQSSFGLSNTGQAGTAFMDTINQLATLSVDSNWKRIEKDPGMKSGILPLTLLVPHVEKEISKYLKDKGYEQKPRLLGKAPTVVDAEATAAPPVAIKAIQSADPNVTGEELALVLKELALSNDNARRLSTTSFPPMSLKSFEKYQPDYATDSELEGKLSQYPHRMMTMKATKVLDRSLKSFRMRFPEESDEANFKKKIEQEQESPAYVSAELSDLLDDMKKLDEKRDEEKSARWLAHFDYTQARVLAQMAHVQEYSFVLGNKLRKDTPKIKDPKNHNGWIIVPQKKLEQKETRGFDSERQKLLTKIIKEHPGTPWEILARREQATILGLTLQETFLEEGKTLTK